MEKYKIINGTAYHTETSDKVIQALETARQNKQRIKIYFGDAITGKDWNEVHDTTGTIGRSTGEIKIPLLIKTARSAGGAAILDHCIVKIKDIKTGRIIYEHGNYKSPIIEIVPSDLPEYTHSTIVNGKLCGRHKSLKKAEMLKNKLS